MPSPTDHAEADSYRASGFSNRLGWGKRPALLLIDICAAYFTPGSPLDCSSNPSASTSPDKMRKLLTSARASNSKIPIIHTQVSYSKQDMSEAGLFYKKAKVIKDVWLQGNDPNNYAAPLPGLEPAEDGSEHVIVKKHPSAFFGTELCTLLHYLEVDTLVICGVSTSGCVRATTLDALQNNFRPMVVGEACGDRSEAIHDANIFDMDAKMADVVGLEEAVERLEMGWL